MILVAYDKTTQKIEGLISSEHSITLQDIFPGRTDLSSFTVDESSDFGKNALSLYPNFSFTLDAAGNVTSLGPVTMTLDEVKQTKIAELLAKRNAAIEGGFTSPTTNHQYYSQESDLRKLQGQASLLALDVGITSVDWLTADAGMVTHTRDEFISVLKEGGQHERDQHNKYYSLEADVETAYANNDRDGIKAVTW